MWVSRPPGTWPRSVRRAVWSGRQKLARTTVKPLALRKDNSNLAGVSRTGPERARECVVGSSQSRLREEIRLRFQLRRDTFHSTVGRMKSGAPRGTRSRRRQRCMAVAEGPKATPSRTEGFGRSAYSHPLAVVERRGPGPRARSKAVFSCGGSAANRIAVWIRMVSKWC